MKGENSILKNGVLAFLFLLMTAIALGQEKQKISATYNAVPFKKWVDTIESITPYFFYYDAQAMDTFRITMHAEELTVAQILQKAFHKTAFHFHIDSANHVFISSQLPIQTNLPVHFFDKTAPANDSIALLALAFQRAVSAENLETTANNKRIKIGKGPNPLKGKASISGYIRHTGTGEAIAGATV